MFRKCLLIGSVSVLFSAGAQAADIIEPAAYDWTGPYVGLQAGYAWGENDLSAGNVGEIITGEVQALDAATIEGEDGTFDLDGFVGGAHAGYNWQSDSLVLGVEGDIEYADLNDEVDILSSDGSGELVGVDEVEINWLGSLRLRAGFAADRALFYATGGLAVGGAKLTAKDEDGEEFADDSATKWGWTIGGGVEYALTDELSGRIEYRYTDLGKINVRNDEENIDDEAELTFHAVRAGLSWHFQ
ncbi:outer membrane protein [Aestuariivirga sp. YIM B02566]|uniref:Porin family protein n=1 Tax=Taklimakanibacter albus TaxID=2800327 RepID=A0ACC5R2G5_9HYPH|nr:outer membrane protein [Aestuariivirga sp. YIM B02566]MBK1866777.1 porin family protein [Aestuariivirga sp. YIM B02566]